MVTVDATKEYNWFWACNLGYAYCVDCADFASMDKLETSLEASPIECRSCGCDASSKPTIVSGEATIESGPCKIF